MSKQDQYAKQLKKLDENFDQRLGRDFSYLLDENFKCGKHIMLIEEKKFETCQKSMAKIQKENALLEKVDLIDFWNISENGRTNKTR